MAADLLPYESQIVQDLLQEDGLLIVAKGLGLDRILLNMIRVYCEPQYLIVVLNTSTFEERYIIDELNMIGGCQLPRIVTNEVSASEREVLYQKGGVLFVTSRILVVDMLMKRLPTKLLTGIIVHRAHKLGESSQEGFILRLFRQENQSGFIKGLSDSPVTFMSGYSQVERVMKNLFVRKLYLWPRFHADVVNCLEKFKPSVEELHIDMTPGMNGIQMAILELIDQCLRDLKKAAPSVDNDELTVENSLTSSFDKVLKASLDSMWHQLSGRSRQLVEDIKILRTLLSYLTQYDCVTFNSFLNSLRVHESGASNKSLWMFMDAANALFVCARERVHGRASKNHTSNPNVELQCEVSPKWNALIEILKEIDDANRNVSATMPVRTLVCASDERTCHQLRKMLCKGAECVMSELSQRTKLSGGNEPSGGNAGRRLEGQMKGKRGRKIPFNRNPEPESVATESELTILPFDGVVIIHPLSGCSDPYSLLRKLYEMEPTNVVLYDMEMCFVRQLEVFAASRPGSSLQVYCMIYAGSVEEQKYLTTLRREKDAFELLIRQKASMVIPEERDAKSSVAQGMLRDASKPADKMSTRKAASREAESKKDRKIIVDMREFRSELPSLIHRRGIDIEPVTLEVGDYILSPQICVERKSLSDLIGSLNSGRLYNQALAMTRFYPKSILLIEFDDGKSFSLQSKSALGSEINSQSIMSKLTLLTIHFPKLRIIWSQSPSVTAEIFDDLKINDPEPDAASAMAVGIDSGESASDVMHNLVSQDFVKKMPGIDSRNYRKILNKVKCIADLTKMTVEELNVVVENLDVAKKVYEFLHGSSLS